MTVVGVRWQPLGMVSIPESNYSPRWPGDDRPPLPTTGTELEILTATLDWHRDTFRLKCAGLPAERLSERSVPPSRLTLHGLLRHLTGAERWWFRIQFAGEGVPMLYYSDDDPDQDFESLDGDVEVALALWLDECEQSRRVVREASGLDDTGTVVRTGEPISLRAVLVRMIAEYARHDGHADLLRERIDGAVGQ